MNEFSSQYRDPQWQKKRLEALQEADWACQRCGDRKTTLHVHHKRYVKGRKVWEYEIDELSVLCEPCHEQEHSDLDLLMKVLAGSGAMSSVASAALTAGYLEANFFINEPGVAEMARQASPDLYELGFVAAILEWNSATAGREVWREIIRRESARLTTTSPQVRALLASWDEDQPNA